MGLDMSAMQPSLWITYTLPGSPSPTYRVHVFPISLFAFPPSSLHIFFLPPISRLIKQIRTRTRRPNRNQRKKWFACDDRASHNLATKISDPKGGYDGRCNRYWPPTRSASIRPTSRGPFCVDLVAVRVRRQVSTTKVCGLPKGKTAPWALASAPEKPDTSGPKGGGMNHRITMTCGACTKTVRTPAREGFLFLGW